MTEEERQSLVQRAMDLCGILRDEEHPKSWGKEFEEGFVVGCANCLSLIHNSMMYQKPTT